MAHKPLDERTIQKLLAKTDPQPTVLPPVDTMPKVGHKTLSDAEIDKILLPKVRSVKHTRTMRKWENGIHYRAVCANHAKHGDDSTKVVMLVIEKKRERIKLCITCYLDARDLKDMPPDSLDTDPRLR